MQDEVCGDRRATVVVDDMLDHVKGGQGLHYRDVGVRDRHGRVLAGGQRDVAVRVTVPAVARGVRGRSVLADRVGARGNGVGGAR